MSREFTSEEIRGLLAELGRRLSDRGVRADIKLVGGAAVAFTGSSRRTTTDIDASYAPREAVEEVVAEMARELDLASDWLNASAAAWIPEGARWVSIDLDAPIKVEMATAETLLAMKLCRADDRDIADIRHLMLHLDLIDPAGAAQLAAELYGSDDVAFTEAAREDAEIVASEAVEKPFSEQ